MLFFGCLLNTTIGLCATFSTIPAPTLWRDGEVMSGIHQVSSLVVPEGSTVWVEDDLQLFATGAVRIAGRLLAFDADALGRVHAPRIHITSNLAIDVPGEIHGGRGANPFAGPGGDGSSISLAAPLIYVDGGVQSGAGGRGGAGGDGGQSGHLTTLGYCLVREWRADHFSLMSGPGGEAGSDGRGGSSGDVHNSVSEAVRASILQMLPQAQQALDSLTAQEPPPSPGCANGVKGGDGANASSGDVPKSANGRAGDNDNPPTGGRLGNKSGDCTGTDGLPGNPGLDCCPNPGGTGGPGGKAGGAVSGKGGDGGDGGDGGPGSGVPGGTGGDGGASGFAKGGRAGNGGAGGKAGGGGGPAGNATATVMVGAAGVGGAGGSGTPNGSGGSPGAPGTHTGVSGGTAGNPGAACPP